MWILERGALDDYMRYYEEAINNTSTTMFGIWVIPADDKMCRYRKLFLGRNAETY
jgi:polyphosphate kinase 2 (PPK2 family)